MPLTPSVFDLWLDPGVKDPRKFQAVLVPFPADEEAYPVSTPVNGPADEMEACIGQVA
jgi:hypothetical protein